MWTLPACTCPRDPESIDTRGCERHDLNSDWNLDPRAFYDEGFPCESCGHPTQEPRIWNAEHELWVASDCACNEPLPEVKPCEVLDALLAEAKTIGEVCTAFRTHRNNCRLCGPVEMPSPKIEQWKEAA